MVSAPSQTALHGSRTPRASLIALALALAAALLIAACGSGSDPGTDSQTPAGGAAAEAGESAEPPAELSVSSAGWSTDFATASVPLNEFLGGGPSKDGIPSIDDPRFVDIDEADDFLEDSEPVALLEVDGVARAYPIQILTWHEIVNDEIAGMPVAVTFCPLCNSTVAFSREVDGRTLEFGTTGNLRNSDLVMYDRETESWWQQLTAEAIVGELTGTKLEVLPSQIVSWGELKRLRPEAKVLSRSTGIDRPYGQNPYTGYDADPEEQPFLLEDEVSDALAPKERVTSVQFGDGDVVVYPFTALEAEAPINDTIGDREAVVFFDPEVGSALDDAVISRSRNVGAAAVFEREVDGRDLSFEATDEGGVFADTETGTLWNMLGEGVSGSLEGEQLTQIPSDDQFWFAVAAFFEQPDIRS